MDSEEIIPSQHVGNISYAPRFVSASEIATGVHGGFDEANEIISKEATDRVASSTVHSEFNRASSSGQVVGHLNVSDTDGSGSSTYAGGKIGEHGRGAVFETSTATEPSSTQSRRNPRLSRDVSYGSKSGESFDEIVEEFASFNSAVSQLAPTTHSSDTLLGYATETKSAETEQLFSSVQEEKKTFFIRAVLDQRTGKRISMQQAFVEGIIHPETGNYVNPDTGVTIPIPEAMSNGLIEVSFASTHRGQERKSTIGIITIKTRREKQRPYKIKSVTNTESGKKISYKEALNNMLIDQQQGTFKNIKRNTTMMITDAAKEGLVDLQYVGDMPEPEEVCKKYAVRAVVDKRNKKIITFPAAVSRGIINKESGAYLDNLTGESMYVGDAIIRGFLKARLIDNTHSLNIDPENHMVIDKTETIRKKLLSPLKVISAFRKAASFRNLDK